MPMESFSEVMPRAEGPEKTASWKRERNTTKKKETAIVLDIIRHAGPNHFGMLRERTDTHLSGPICAQPP